MDHTVVVLLVALVWAVGYAITVAIWPFGACWRCGGDGRLRSPSGKAWRRCKRCKGGGARLRIGRRVLNRLSRTAERASR
jgi:hypothetical protein